MSFPFVQPYFGLGNSLQTAQAGGAGGIGGWVELARTTLGSAGDDIDVTSIANKRYLMILNDVKMDGSDGQMTYRFNADSGTNYARRYSINGASDSTSLSNTQAPISDGLGGNPGFAVSYVSNLAAKEKLVLSQCCEQNTAGAGTAPNRYEATPKWANTSNAINAVGMHNSSTSDFSIGSETVVLGWDPEDTHTTNFWEELASVSANGSSNTLSASFTSKKYLWVQCYEESSAGSVSFRVGNSTLDTGNNYALRYSSDGGAEDLTTGIDSMDGLTSTTPIFWNYFIINNSASEKLAMCHVVRQNTAGAGTAPKRIESVSKWANTSAQIDTVGFTAADGGATILSNSILKVWGAN
jgi:hypothetical protein